MKWFNPSIQYITEGEKRQQKIIEYSVEDGRAVKIKQTMHYESSTQINRIEWYYYINGAFNSIQKRNVKMYYPQELDSYLEWNGFNILHKFGSFEEEVFNGHSGKQIFVCQIDCLNKPST